METMNKAMENGDNEKGSIQCACPCQANIGSQRRNKWVYVHQGGKHPDCDYDEEDGGDENQLYKMYIEHLANRQSGHKQLYLQKFLFV